MTVERNSSTITGAYDAFARADVAALAAVFADDVVWHYPGTSELSGDHVGRDAVLGFLGQFIERTGGSYRAQLREVMANDEYASGWANDVAARDGKVLDVNAVVVFRMHDDVVTEAWHYFDDLAALDDFWA